MAKLANPSRIGRRTTDPRGYVLVYVGKGHRLADNRGYAYEHRLIAESTGQRLRAGQLVHHEDEMKSNNLPETLRWLLAQITFGFTSLGLAQEPLTVQKGI